MHDPSTFQKVIINEVDEGQPCLACNEDVCPGFTPHEWRFVSDLLWTVHVVLVGLQNIPRCFMLFGLLLVTLFLPSRTIKKKNK